ncbi:MAG: hypothetical protein GTN82_15625 [Candidatus Aminicenantes bacterium]|nr:hypothetical protein [Candidatus Aminicenantes bacterium]
MIAIDAGVTKPLSFVLFAEEIQRRTEEATERWFFPFQDLVKMWVESEAQEI